VNAHRPHVDQADRDLLADVGLAENDDRAGSGDQAQHHDEVTAS
jgi:hypothetical protein